MTGAMAQSLFCQMKSASSRRSGRRLAGREGRLGMGEGKAKGGRVSRVESRGSAREGAEARRVEEEKAEILKS